VVERLAYDPWGKRRFINTTPGKSDTLDAIVGIRTDRGFTEHEHLDEMGVVHMNGRIYDPLIGRFMSADPFIQAPDNLQSYNRYSYVMNNPLTLTDPSGYFSKRKLLRYAFGVFGHSKTVRQIITFAACTQRLRKIRAPRSNRHGSAWSPKKSGRCRNFRT
jgi:RHS repeat-associated protein